MLTDMDIRPGDCNAVRRWGSLMRTKQSVANLSVGFLLIPFAIVCIIATVYVWSRTKMEPVEIAVANV